MHRITDMEFARVKMATRMRDVNLGIVYRVLVENQSQAQVHRDTGKSRQHISLLVNVFWEHYLRIHPVPHGWLTGSVVLPAEDWVKVRELERRAKARLAKSSGKK